MKKVELVFYCPCSMTGEHRATLMSRARNLIRAHASGAAVRVLTLPSGPRKRLTGRMNGLKGHRTIYHVLGEALLTLFGDAHDILIYNADDPVSDGPRFRSFVKQGTAPA